MRPVPPSRAAGPSGPGTRPAEATREIRLHGQAVAYRLRRTPRRSIGFTIGADGLTVAVPRGLAAAEIDAALHGKAAWVLRKLAEQRERVAEVQASRVEWRDGATLPFLGRMLRVTLDGRVAGAVLDAAAAPASDKAAAVADAGLAAAQGSPGGNGGDGAAPLALRIGLPAGAAPARIRDAVQDWLRRQARRVFEERCAHYAPRLGVRPRRVSLSSARTRWGSASADGSVRLNWRLVHFALPTLDYVVVHELAHLRHMDHGPQFWAVVRTAVPDLEGARGALRRALLPAFD